MSVKAFTEAPAVQSCRLVDFDTYSIAKPQPPVLVVHGTAPCLNMEVSLQPVIYVQCPEYWRIEVVGCLPGGFCLPATKPYVAYISLAGIVGSKGIEIAGANKTEPVELGGGCHGSTSFDAPC